MRTFFIADAHLGDPRDRSYQTALAFLRSIRGRTNRLVILGDFFQFWIGYGEDAFPHYHPLLEALIDIKREGSEILYFEGNHDFHLGPFFEETLGARVFPGPATLLIDGLNIHLCHGDEVNRNEPGARMLRRMLHGPLIPLLIPLIPPSVAFRIAGWMSGLSRRKDCGRPKTGIPDLIRGYADQRFAEGCDAVVMGHFHLPLLEKRDGWLMALGEWGEKCCYGELQEGEFRLVHWDPASGLAASRPKSSR